MEKKEKSDFEMDLEIRTREKVMKNLEITAKVFATEYKKAIKSLIQNFENEEYEEIKIGIIEILGNVGYMSEDAKETLIECLNDENEQIQIVAADVLGMMGCKEATKPLMEIMNNEESIIQEEAKEALMQIQEKYQEK